MNLKKLRAIKAFVLDVDGVLTDGSILVTNDGDQLRTMNIKDGYALQHAVKAGYQILVISGGTSEGVRSRLNKLGVIEVYLGATNKEHVLKESLGVLNLTTDQCLAMGDDIPDLKILEMAGYSACPADAVAEIRYKVDYISPFGGGKGAVRDIIEHVMRISDKW